MRLFNRKRAEFIGQHVEDIPEKLDLKVVYMVGQAGNKWLGVMLCPCMCGEIIQLNLLKDSKPCWKIIKHRNNSVTIRPSVWRIINCKSHFIIRKGRISWVRNVIWCVILCSSNLGSIEDYGDFSNYFY